MGRVVAGGGNHEYALSYYLLAVFQGTDIHLFRISHNIAYAENPGDTAHKRVALAVGPVCVKPPALYRMVGEAGLQHLLQIFGKTIDHILLFYFSFMDEPFLFRLGFPLFRCAQLIVVLYGSEVLDSSDESVKVGFRLALFHKFRSCRLTVTIFLLRGENGLHQSVQRPVGVFARMDIFLQ